MDENQELRIAARRLAIGCLAILQVPGGQMSVDDAVKAALDALQKTQHLLGPTAYEMAMVHVREVFGIDI